MTTVSPATPFPDVVDESTTVPLQEAVIPAEEAHVVTDQENNESINVPTATVSDREGRVVGDQGINRPPGSSGLRPGLPWAVVGLGAVLLILVLSRTITGRRTC